VAPREPAPALGAASGGRRGVAPAPPGAGGFFWDARGVASVPVRPGKESAVAEGRGPGQGGAPGGRTPRPPGGAGGAVGLGRPGPYWRRGLVGVEGASAVVATILMVVQTVLSKDKKLIFIPYIVCHC
jgi:hypothetical protein